MAPSARSTANGGDRLKDSPLSDDKDDQGHLSDSIMRKKKNAEAQAAFRARRANYISTLEETVNSLESIVLHLQESIRAAEGEALALRNENEQLRAVGQDRDARWRTLWHSHKGDELPEGIPPLPSVFGPVSRSYPPSPAIGHQQPVTTTSPYDHNQLTYPVSPTLTHAPYTMVNSGGDFPAPSAPGPNSFMSVAAYENVAVRERFPSPESYPQSSYPPLYAGQDSTPVGNWPRPVAQTPSAGADLSGQMCDGSSRSPQLVGSPLDGSAPGVAYCNHYAATDGRESSPMPSLQRSQYTPRPPSASSASSVSSTASATLTTPSTPAIAPTQSYHAFAHPSIPDDFRRHSVSHAPSADVILHGGIANIPVAGQSREGVRYRLGPRRTDCGPGLERAMFPALPSVGQIGHGHPGDDGATARARQRVTHSPSPSPSPASQPPVSGTLQVIKSQAFGSLRRGRASPKRTAEAAKFANEALEARGITLGSH
ncbi:hypothetical protein K488DRAFT_70085 [Vararia minispora EC-137]|uniref:Uncharacterized protein n=1 Tax=Vararia minispora EC-137 TaxID=1314806 RepID=A0ACB8QNB4_9AGAM|nr:hypothetical protein K488DRAFT_70085 [Vararia minispora EC-137]